jgi:hypothetical protein
VNLGINYGDVEPTAWFNKTTVEMGATLLDVTEAVAKVKVKHYPGMGAFVESINGVENRNPNFWMWWTYSSLSWYEGPIAADRYIVAEGETLFWYYEDTSVSPLPIPPAK